jgi:heat shock protein HslJ
MKTFLLIAAGAGVLLLAACSSVKPGAGTAPATLTKTQWLVEEIAGSPVAADSRVFIRFEPDRRASGSSGVNNFVGPATAEMGGVKFGALAVTRRAGPPALMDQETRFLKALNDSAKYSPADGGRLQFTAADGTVTLRLAPMAAE